jgi:hypothetical protein
MTSSRFFARFPNQITVSRLRSLADAESLRRSACETTDAQSLFALRGADAQRAAAIGCARLMSSVPMTVTFERLSVALGE